MHNGPMGLVITWKEDLDWTEAELLIPQTENRDYPALEIQKRPARNSGPLINGLKASLLAGSFNEATFFDLGRFLTDPVTNIIEPRPTSNTLTVHFDPIDGRRIHRKYFLNPFAKRDAADSKSFVDTTSFSCDDNTRKYLDAFFAGFLDFDVNTHTIAHFELG